MTSQPSIQIEEICKKVFRDTVLDVFYLIQENKDISKKQIAKFFQEIDGGSESSQKYRFKINEALAKLEGTLFVDSWVDGTPGAPSRYYLTPYGEVARDYLGLMFEEDPKLYKGTKIISKIMEDNL